MLRILNVSEEVMVTVTLVSDIAYAREIGTASRLHSYVRI